ncbi:hypothetical protein K432DRAFT_383853, partial [Lepidopterella palustris CBS 459.81]
MTSVEAQRALAVINFDSQKAIYLSELVLTSFPLLRPVEATIEACASIWNDIYQILRKGHLGQISGVVNQTNAIFQAFKNKHDPFSISDLSKTHRAMAILRHNFKQLIENGVDGYGLSKSDEYEV